KIGYAYLSFASEDKVDTNYEALQGKELRGRTIRIDYVGEKSKSHENGAKSLFVGNLPKDVTTDELKALSPDIVNVTKNIRSAYILFASEDKVDINYEALKGKELRGKFIRIDYVGKKRKIFSGDVPNLPTLVVDRIPPDASIADVAAHFSTAQQIIYDRSTLERRAIITFPYQKCANEAFNSKIEIKGQMLTIERFSLNNSKQSWMKNSGYQGGSPAHSFLVFQGRCPHKSGSRETQRSSFAFSRKMSHTVWKNRGYQGGNPARSFPRYSRKMSHNSGCRRGNSAKKM
ncbi:multiple RNA-binding domain-containing protein 1, partial [Nephila pilipes]